MKSYVNVCLTDVRFNDCSKCFPLGDRGQGDRFLVPAIYTYTPIGMCIGWLKFIVNSSLSPYKQNQSRFSRDWFCFYGLSRLSFEDPDESPHCNTCDNRQDGRSASMQQQQGSPQYPERTMNGAHPFVTNLVNEESVPGDREQNGKCRQTGVDFMVMKFGNQKIGAVNRDYN